MSQPVIPMIGRFSAIKLLLDTHIWLWLINEPEKIGASLARKLDDPANELWLSPISSWEILMLDSKRRIRLRENSADWIGRATSRFREAPLSHEIVVAADKLSFAHRDPADRFLAATAKVLGLTLATSDTKLLGLGDIATIANR